MFGYYLLVLSLALVLGQDPTNEDKVVILTDDSLEMVISKYKYVLVEFYAEWCQPCQQFAPEYSQLAAKVQEEQVPVVVAKIDGSVHRISNQRFNIESFPTFKLFLNGVPLNYEGQRGLTQMFEFLKETTGESLDELPNVEDVEQFLEEFPVALIYFIESYQDKNLHIYNTVSKLFTDIAFGYTNSAEARQKYKARKNSIVLFKNFDEERNEFKGKVSDKALSKFLDENAYPTFSQFDERAEERIFKKQKSALILFWDDSGESQRYKKLIQYIAPLIKKRVQVVAVHPKEGFLTSILERLGTQSVKYPDIFFYKVSENNKGETYRFKEELSLDNILRFMDHASVGKLEKIYRSQEAPAEQTGPVLQLVGDTFDQLVRKSGKDVFVVFYSQYDKESQRVLPELKQLAESFANNPNIIFAQIDAVYNEVPDAHIKTHPSYRFYRQLLPTVPLEFIKEFNYDNVVSHLKAHTSFPWVEPVKVEKQENVEKTDL